MEYHQAPSAAKLANGIGGAGGGGGLSGKHVYDGVFGGAVKSGTARMEDYREIFSGSRNCSIPILDFPEINSSGDARSSKPDYSMIFGGFREADYGVGVPYEELIAKPNKDKSLSKNARTPAEVRFCPAVPERSSILEEKKPQSPEVCLQSFDGVKQFNVSYNKSNRGNKNGTDGITHVDQLHSIPAYTCMVDETTPSQMTDTIKPVRAVLNDAHMNININEPMKAGKHLRKVVSGPQPRGAAIDTSTIRVERQKKSSRNRSFSNDISFDGFEIGLGTYPSRMSPLRSVHNVGNNKGQTMKSVNSKFGVYKSETSEGAAGSYSPTLSDEEIDANSAAATSAAALRKAIEEAQVKMKIAKELMEKKRQGFHNRSKSSFTDSSRNTQSCQRRGSKAAAQEMHHKVCTTTKQVFTMLPENNETKVGQINSDIRNAEQSSTIKNAIGETHSTESRRAPVNHILEAQNGKATNGFSEPAGACEPKSTALEVKQVTNIENVKPCNDENESKEKMAGEENRKNPVERDKKIKAYEEAPKEKIERVLNSVAAAFKWDIFRNFIKSDEDIHSQEENENKTRVAHAHKEADRTPEVPHKQEAQAKSETEEMEKSKDVKELKEGEHWVTIDKKETEADDQEEVENQSNEVRLRMESKTLLHEIDGHKVKGREDLDGVKYEKKQNDVPKQEDAELSGQAHKQEVTVVSSNIDFQEKVESEERLREDCGTVGNENLEEAKENVNMFNSINENQTEKTCEVLETEKMRTDIHVRADDAKVTQQSFRFQESNLETSNDVYNLDENMNAGNDDEACGDEKFERVQKTSGVVVEETNRMMEVTGDSSPEEAGMGSKAVEEAHDLVEDDLDTGDPEQGLIGVDGMQTADVYLVKPVLTVDHKPNGYHVMEYAEVCEHEKHIKEVTSLLDENDVSETEIGVDDEENESNFASYHEGKRLGMEIESKTLCGPEEQVEESVYELGQNYRDVKEEPEVTTNIEDENFFESYSEGKCVNNTIGGQPCQQPYIFEEEGKNIRVSLEGIANQSTDKKEESHHETLTVEKHDTEDTLQKEVELEEKYHGRKEETKLRDMEKEKERIAVERAIREARERAFAEARDRAERAAAEKAAAEAHQRMMAGAREKIEKACAEANGKSAVEKASMEAKLKAERAAVERATAEARERALERALSEKAALKAQAEKVAAEKFSRGARDAGFKSTDQQYKGAGPPSSSRYPSSSNHDVPYSTDRLNGTNCESVERCKATLEKNQRTAERAAKALAEKNMRDFLAQKEQAERNRLAEILDADVKRWSSGKERNLRALLSTLQYILGPDSGWQPISLTDIISSAAVKKAYRKATLFVHPDKLQQRGASIQQKYTCEKVFDLLKDAWNKFSAEER